MTIVDFIRLAIIVAEYKPWVWEGDYNRKQYMELNKGGKIPN